MKGRPRHTRHGLDAALAATATLTAAWPISTLLTELTWLRGTALLLAVIALSGVGARSLGLRPWHVLTVQLVCSLLAAGAIFGRGHLWFGLPTFETLRFANGLILESIATAQRYAAPAPATPGLMFLVGCSLGLVALAVDYLGVTLRSPSLAGLPLLTVFLATVANRGSTLPVLYFVAAAAIWLILVARVNGTFLRSWGNTVAVGHTPAPQYLQSQGAYGSGSMARLLGAGALIAAVAVPVVVPHAPPTFLASGLGRSPDSDDEARTVGFSQSLDLSADLKSPSRAPVLQFTTRDTSPPPLRAAVGFFYRPDAGVWLPWGRSLRSSTGRPALSTNPIVPEPAGLSPGVPRKTFVMNVRRNVLEDPYLAAPYPMVDADLGQVAWASDEQTQSARVAERPNSYTVSYLRVEPTVAMLRSSPALTESDQDRFDADLTVEGPYLEKVTALTDELTSGKSSAYDKAMAIQQYLRADGGFTYSLTLAPPVRNRSGQDAGLDALTSFLVTKQGYCVQFATAMVMMSRAAGIPARMDIGFLPGTLSDGVWKVVAADAHAWPELYLDGIGWTRFEPTPSRGAPPPYAVPTTLPGTALDGSPLATATATAPAPGAAARRELEPSSTGNGASTQDALSPTAILRWLTQGWGPALLALLVGLAGSLVVPTAALWRRRRNLASAHTDARRVEVQWDLLTSSLGDLGIAPAPSRTPRQLHAYYDREALLEEAASQALGRVVQTLERSRYEASPPPLDTLSADARRVYKAAAETRGTRERVRATFWPSSGVTALRHATVSLTERVQSPLRAIAIVIRRRFSRRQKEPGPKR